MTPSALPWIAEASYSSFQQMIAELRHTSYQEWMDEHAKAVAYRRSRNGSNEIPISPQEFDAWIKENHESPHLELLWVFAEEKATGLTQSTETSNLD